MTLLLKLVLVPGLIALVTLAGRRFGPRIGGWLNALPLVAGPVLFFLALEQGDLFVARAAEATLAGLAAVAAFAVVYAWIAVTRRWWVCVLGGWAAFAGVTIALQAVQWTAVSGLAVALAGFALARLLLPASSGAITPFPVATTILLAFTHAQQGTPAAAGFLRAFLPAMWSFALFCFVLAWGVVGLGRDLAILAALAVHLAALGLVWLALEASASRGSARRGPRAARRSA